MSKRAEGLITESAMQWGSILTVIILTGICVLSLLLNYRSATASEILPVSIQANKVADYSADGISALNPVVNIEIVEEAIKDQDPTNVVERIENVRANLQTPVPTVTPTPIVTNTPVQVSEQDDTPQALETNPPAATATPRPSKTATASKTTLATGTPATATKTSIVTSTSNPTDTSEKTATATTIPGATATATEKVTQTETKVPPTATDTATKVPPTATKVPPTATDTATNVPPTATKVPPTATDTATKVPPTATKVPPTATDTATNIPPTATKNPPTATYTPTKIPPTATTIPPTATMTPTTMCTRPDYRTGYVAYTYPKDNAEDVPRDVVIVIQFNQAMYEGDLFNNIKVSGTKVGNVMSYDPGTYRLEIRFQEWLESGAKILVEVKRNTKNICMWRQIVEVEFEFTVTRR